MTLEKNNESLHWRAYFARFGPRLILFARQWLPDLADAEDAVQDVFVRFWRKHGSPDDRHVGLLFASVRTAALDHLRRETRRRRRETLASDDIDSPLGAERPDSLFACGPTGDALPVEAALRGLPPEQREVLVLKIWGELTFAQIGEALALSPNTAASRYRYAIDALKKTLRPLCHE